MLTMRSVGMERDGFIFAQMKLLAAVVDGREIVEYCPVRWGIKSR